MNIKDMVKGNFVTFDHYRNGELWYKLTYGDSEEFLFPVQIEDVGNAVLLQKDKAILFMRYIRKHLKVVDTQVESV